MRRLLQTSHHRSARRRRFCMIPSMPATDSGGRSGLPAARWLMWVGSTSGTELALAHTCLGQMLPVEVAENPPQALAGCPQRGGTRPSMILLASDRPGRWNIDDAILLTSRWPLVPVVSVGASLCDGRRRSGPALPGVEEIAWHDVASRIGQWFADLDTGRPGGLGLPTTVRREDRLLESSLLAPRGSLPVEPPPVTLAARRLLDLEGLADLLVLAGRRIERRVQGRPPLSAADATVIWDAGRLDRDDLAWLQLLSSNQPNLPILVLESFPRGDATLAALRAGAWAVVGRPVSLEVVVGTLARLEQAATSGLGPAGIAR